MSTIKVDQLADEVMKQLNDFADATCDDMKAAVKKAGNTVRDQIKSTAPNRTGAYAKSWSVKNTKESSHAFEVTVYSRNRYQLAHLLEFGHAKRGGGRVSGRAHIAPAEQASKGVSKAMDKIMELLSKTGIPFAYDHFAEGESPDPPFICFLLPASDNFSADGQVYFKVTEVHIELYTDKKDLELEERVEAVLDEYGIFYEKNEVWIASEKLYEVMFSFEMEV